MHNQKALLHRGIGIYGTVITEAKDYHSYKQEGTTNYIVIDTESDYVLEGWKASSTNRELNIKDNFYSISATQSGDSAEEIEIDVDNGVKYVYLLFKKQKSIQILLNHMTSSSSNPKSPSELHSLMVQDQPIPHPYSPTTSHGQHQPQPKHPAQPIVIKDI